MRMPRFTAEASLYDGTATYRTEPAAGTALAGEAGVAPQFSPGDLGCEWICIPNRYGAGVDCFWHCPWQIPYLTHPTPGLL
jgi:hypothetical protein